MKVCVVGAGAIGGFLAVKLSQSGQDVSIIARGCHLRAIQENGLTLLEGEKERAVVQVNATSTISTAGVFDVVFLCVKAHQIEAIASELECLCHDKTTIISTQNGIPWWYFQRASHIKEIQERSLENLVISATDPNSILCSSINAERIIGCIVYPAAHIESPGVIKHTNGIRFPIGELDGSNSTRIQEISKMMIKAGFKSPILPDVRSEIWLKCWGSCCFNPLSSLTGATLLQICTFPLTKELAICVMKEVEVIVAKIGATLRVNLNKRIDGAAAVGDHKTSMLQDIENQKETEIEALVGSVVEIARKVNVLTPHLNTLYYCVKLLTNRLEQEKTKQ